LLTRLPQKPDVPPTRSCGSTCRQRSITSQERGATAPRSGVPICARRKQSPLRIAPLKPRNIPEVKSKRSGKRRHPACFGLSFITAPLAGTTWAAGETIDVKYYGKLDLAPFACTDVSRSSFINRACYDKSEQFMVVQLRSVYYPYCEMPAATFEAFLTAPSMGQYYNANIKRSGSDGPFDCRTHRIPKY